jgi:HAD superfamily hydrolase (TIGR01459 family)
MPMNSLSPASVAGLSRLAADYDAVLSDVWGVVHNGVESFPQACEALARYRATTGGKVLLITNAPRPRGPILEQLDRLGVPRAAFDELLTSGEVTRGLIPEDAAVYHVGPERDMSLYQGLRVRLVDEGDAEIVCCTGLFDDERETPEDYRERIARWVARGLPMICANPDIVVERGSELVPCAGALAAIQADLGGEVRLVGKPHSPIYAAALHRLDQLAGRPLDRSRILAIGDGIATDVRGAHGQGLDVLFVTAGIHVAEFGPHDRPDPAKISAFLEANRVAARASIPRLKW